MRAFTGASWKNGEEGILDDLAPTATSYKSDWTLESPGATACFKFFVMATTGNENGGKSIRITRPV